jgi:hypothetical protein
MHALLFCLLILHCQGHEFESRWSRKNARSLLQSGTNPSKLELSFAQDTSKSQIKDPKSISDCPSELFDLAKDFLEPIKSFSPDLVLANFQERHHALELGLIRVRNRTLIVDESRSGWSYGYFEEERKNFALERIQKTVVKYSLGDFDLALVRPTFYNMTFYAN